MCALHTAGTGASSPGCGNATRGPGFRLRLYPGYASHKLRSRIGRDHFDQGGVKSWNLPSL